MNMSDEKVYVIQMQTGEYFAELAYYQVLACHSKDEAEKVAREATDMYEKAFSRIVAPPWNTRTDGPRYKEYLETISRTDKKLIKEYLDMFPILREQVSFSLEGGVEFTVLEIPLV